MKNGGKASRNTLAGAVNDATDSREPFMTVVPQIAGDVIEQRDLLLEAAEGALLKLANYAGVQLREAPEWFTTTHAKLYTAIATAKGE